MTIRSLFNRLLDGSSLPSDAPEGSQAFDIRPDAKNDNIIFISPAGTDKQAPPLYTVLKNSTGDPYYIVHRGPAVPQNTIATASIHLSTTTVDLSILHQPLHMKMNSLSGSCTIDTPHMGRLKWKVNKLTGRGWELMDGSDQKIAKFSSAGLKRFGEKQLFIFIPSDEFTLVLIALSVMSGKALSDIIEEIAGEVSGAVGGA